MNSTFRLGQDLDENVTLKIVASQSRLIVDARTHTAFVRSHHNAPRFVTSYILVLTNGTRNNVAC